MMMRTFSNVFRSLAFVAAFALTTGVGGLRAQPASIPETNEIRVGDRIFLTVDGEKALTDSFTVVAGPAVELPLVGTLSLTGVKKSELEPYLTKVIGRFIKNPVVRAKVKSRIRLTVLGEVGRPGFLDLPAEALLSEVITAAGGPTGESKLNSMQLKRGDKTLLKGAAVRKALDGGQTLTQLGLQSGDQLIVPKGGSFGRFFAVTGSVVASLIGIYYLVVVIRNNR